jgi:PhnB protein
MQPIPYLTFQGTCRAAMTRYAQVFGSPAPEFMRLGDDPDAANHPADRHDLVMHCSLKLGEGWLFGSDDIWGGTPAMAGTSIMVELPGPAARAAFDALAEGGEVDMPFAPTTWSAGFGMLTDRFGTRWMISDAMQGMG